MTTSQMVATRNPMKVLGLTTPPGSIYKQDVDSDAVFRPRRRVKLGAGFEPRRSLDRSTEPTVLSDRHFITAKSTLRIIRVPITVFEEIFRLVD